MKMEKAWQGSIGRHLEVKSVEFPLQIARSLLRTIHDFNLQNGKQLAFFFFNLRLSSEAIISIDYCIPFANILLVQHFFFQVQNRG